MKKTTQIMTVLCLILMTVNSYAQEKFASYSSSYFGKSYEIQLSAKEEGKYTLFIDAASMDKLCDNGGITMTEAQHPQFVSALREAKLKYDEWVKTAKEHDVKEMDKTMPVSSRVSGFFKYGTQWKFQMSVDLTFDFKIVESEGVLKYLMILRTGEMKASDNEFMTVKGFVIVFNSGDEIDKFAKSLAPEQISAFVNKPKAKDLFK